MISHFMSKSHFTFVATVNPQITCYDDPQSLIAVWAVLYAILFLDRFFLKGFNSFFDVPKEHEEFTNFTKTINYVVHELTLRGLLGIAGIAVSAVPTFYITKE